jgi:hypothetical protein
MLDLVYLAVTVLFFALGIAYVAGCERLAPSDKASPPRDGGAS